MVILSASVVTKKGKILLARQYVPMTRLRIEGLLAAFPKLVFSEDNGGSKQHTFVETDEVRYIYQPMDMLYLLLITNMQSNIIEDLGTLRTIAKLIPDYCQGHDEAAVEERAFDLIFAIDEVISPGGYREQVNYTQIQDYTKMDSAEAKLTDIIEISKMENAKQIAKEKEKLFDEKRKRELKLTANAGLQGKLAQVGVRMDLSVLGGIQSVHDGGISSDQVNKFNSKNLDPTITEHGDSNKYQNNDSSSDNDNDKNSSFRSGKSKNFRNKNKSGFGKKKNKSGQRAVGFTLQSMSKNQDKLFDEQMNADKTLLQTNLLNSNLLGGNAGSRGKDSIGAGSGGADTGPMEPVEVSVIEKLSVILDRDGVLKKFEVKGEMEVVVNQPEAAQSKFLIIKPNDVDGFGKINWRLHPRMDQNGFKKNILMLKDETKSFKMGRNAKTAILKWRMSSEDEEMIPIRINFWPEPESGEISVNVTYSVEKEGVELNNVIVTLPTPTSSQPDVTQCDGQYTFYNREHELQWNLGDLKTGDDGEFVYTLEECEVEDLWPVSVHFEMPNTFLKVSVDNVANRQTEEEFKFSTKYVCSAESYKIE